MVITSLLRHREDGLGRQGHFHFRYWKLFYVVRSSRWRLSRLTTKIKKRIAYHIVVISHVFSNGGIPFSTS